MYSFGGSDPTNYSDPFGLAACCTEVTDWTALRHVLAKHVQGVFGKGWNMFTDMERGTLKYVISQTVSRGEIVGKQLVNGEVRYVIERNWKGYIGTRGEEIVRVVVSEAGELRTAFPVKNAFVAAAERNAAAGIAEVAAGTVLEATGVKIATRGRGMAAVGLSLTLIGVILNIMLSPNTAYSY